MQRLSLLALVSVLFVASCSDSSSQGTGPAPDTSAPTTTTSGPPAPGQSTGATELTIKDFAFEPRTLTVPVGTTIRVTNEDSAVHTWTSDGNWDSGDLGKGESFTFVLKEKGTFSYDCTPHPSMTGTVTVT